MSVMRANGRVPAIEVSVNATADKLLFCMHDTTFDRTTTGTGNSYDKTWSDVTNNIITDDTDFLGTGWNGLKLNSLTEVMASLFGRAVIFIEPKSNHAIPLLQAALLNDYPDAQDSIVWKMPYDNAAHAWAKSNGFTTWGYIETGTTDGEMDAVDANIDMWGVPIELSDSRIEEIVSRGKPVISWEVHRRYDANRLQGLGVEGAMCAQIGYCTRTTTVQYTMKALASDDFASETKAPGNMGRLGYTRSHQVAYTSAGEAYFPVASQKSFLLGSLVDDPDPSNYTINFSMKWDVLPSSTIHSGIAFGKPDDQPYLFSSTNPSGGYHVAMRAGGDFQLYRHDAGVTTGVLLATQSTTAPSAGAWMTFQIIVSPTQISIDRTDVVAAPATSNDTTYRGPFMHLSTGSVTTDAQTPYWKDISQV
jgi:glycerophosphoryl diester phosphodiesterase